MKLAFADNTPRCRQRSLLAAQRRFDVDPRALAIAQQYVDGEIPVDQMTAAIVALSTDYIRPYGEPLAFTPVELRTTAEGNAALFRVRFATQTLTWAVRVSPQDDQRFRSAPFRPQPRVPVVTRLIEG
jgi:hypothetical protein